MRSLKMRSHKMRLNFYGHWFLQISFFIILAQGSSAKVCELNKISNTNSEIQCTADISHFSKNLTRSTCLSDCEVYINQLDHPEKMCPSPSEVQSLCQPSLQSYLDYFKQPENLMSLATACTRGEIEGVQLAFDQLELYKNLAVKAADAAGDAFRNMPQSLRALFSQQVEKSNDFNAWVKRCDQKWECKSSIARSVSKYSEKLPNGQYKIGEKELKSELKNKSMLVLIGEARSSKAQLKNKCLSSIEQYSDQWTQRSYPTGLDRQWARYRLIKANHPECLNPLEILPPAAVASASKDKGLLESLGIKLQCYSPAKTRELICMQAVAFILDPLNLLGGVGGLAAKIAAKAGVKAAVKGAAELATRTAGKVFGLLGETAEVARFKAAESLIKRTLSQRESQALLDAHYVGVGEKGKNGQWASVSNYTDAQIAQKYKILRAAGFSESEARLLMQKGIAGLDTKEAAEAAVKISNLRTGIQSASSAQNPLAAMGLGPNSTLKDFDEAYKAMTKLYHPDKLKLISGLTNEEKKSAQEIFAQINSLKENRGKLQEALDSLSVTQRVASDSSLRLSFVDVPATSKIQIADYANMSRMVDRKPEQFIQEISKLSAYSPTTAGGAQIATESLLKGVVSTNGRVKNAAMDALGKYVPQMIKTQGYVAEEARSGFYQGALSSLNSSRGEARERLRVVLRQSLEKLPATSGKSSAARQQLERLLGM